MAACPRLGSESGTCHLLAVASFRNITIPNTFHLDRSDSSRRDRRGNKTSCCISEDLAGGRRWTGQLVSPAPRLGALRIAGQVGRWFVSRTQAGISPSPAGPANAPGPVMCFQHQGQQRPPGSTHSRASASQVQTGSRGSLYSQGAGDPPKHTGHYTHMPSPNPRTPSFQRAWGVRRRPSHHSACWRCGRPASLSGWGSQAEPSGPLSPLPGRSRSRAAYHKAARGGGRPGLTDPQLTLQSEIPGNCGERNPPSDP